MDFLRAGNFTVWGSLKCQNFQFPLHQWNLIFLLIYTASNCKTPELLYQKPIPMAAAMATIALHPTMIFIFFSIFNPTFYIKIIVAYILKNLNFLMTTFQIGVRICVGNKKCRSVLAYQTAIVKMKLDSRTITFIVLFTTLLFYHLN